MRLPWGRFPRSDICWPVRAAPDIALPIPCSAALQYMSHSTNRPSEFFLSMPCCFLLAQSAARTDLGALRSISAHSLETGLVGIDVCYGFGRAGLGTGRIATTQVALDHLAGVLVVIDRTERTGNRADLATD